MGKKIKLGTVKVRREITVTQKLRRQINIQPIKTFEISNQATQSLITERDLDTQQAKIQKYCKKVRPIHLPVGVYSSQVEQLYDEINKRSKPEELEDSALYDVFISHASEDKDDFVIPLVEALQDAGIRVWYDCLEMEWGKSLREQIDNGIRRSKYAIIILSKNFFAKQWTKRELDGILAKEEATGVAPMPIWYNISFNEVYEFSPTLSGLYSLSTDKYSIEDICQSFKLILFKEEIRA